MSGESQEPAAPASAFNPYAAPMAEASDIAQELPQLRGRMPGSVIGAITLTLVFLALLGFLVIATLSFGGVVGVIELLILLVPTLIGVLVVIGLFRRNRLARQWGRIAALLGAVLISVIIVMGFGTMLYLLNSGDSSMPEDIPQGFFILSMFLGMLVYIVPAAMLWAVFFCLGRVTAKQYFRLVCPQCQSRRTRPANFLYSRVRCKECRHLWA